MNHHPHGRSSWSKTTDFPSVPIATYETASARYEEFLVAGFRGFQGFHDHKVKGLLLRASHGSCKFVYLCHISRQCLVAFCNFIQFSSKHALIANPLAPVR